MNEPDPVDRALERLREAPVDTAPDPRLEARLRRAHGERPVRRRLRAWIPIGATLALSGAAFAAGGGVGWLRSWWYGVEVDGVPVTGGEVQGDGARTLHFRDARGGEGTVTVERTSVPGGRRTGLAIARRDASGEEREAAVTYEGAPPPSRRHPRAWLDDALPVHAGTDELGEAFQVWARLDGEGGTRLLLDRPRLAEPTVEELFVVPLELTAPGVTFELSDTEPHGLRLVVREGPGLEREWIWSGPAAPSATGDGATELGTPDGSVRVRVTDPPTER